MGHYVFIFFKGHSCQHALHIALLSSLIIFASHSIPLKGANSYILDPIISMHLKKTTKLQQKPAQISQKLLIYFKLLPLALEQISSSLNV